MEIFPGLLRPFDPLQGFPVSKLMHTVRNGVPARHGASGCFSTALKGIFYLITEPVHYKPPSQQSSEVKTGETESVDEIRIVRTESTATTQAGDDFYSTDSDVYCISDGMRQAVMAARACNMKCC